MKLLQIRRNATCEIGHASGYEKKDNVIGNIEACIGGGGRGCGPQYRIYLEVNRQISHIHVSKWANTSLKLIFPNIPYP